MGGMVVYIPAIYFIIFLAYAILFLCVLTKNKVGGVLIGMFLMVLSIYTFVNGVNEMNNFVTTFFSALTFAFGVYSSFDAGYNLIMEGM